MPHRNQVLEALLASTHLVAPDELPALIARHARGFGASSAVLYLADRDQCWLVPVIADGAHGWEDVAIERTLAGRAYRSMEIFETSAGAGESTVWAPVVDGTERLGVLQFAFPGEPPADHDSLRAFVGLVAELVMTKQAYGDFFELARRRKPMSVAAELAWHLLPPLTFGTEQLVIAAACVPTADLGGDVFDYGVDMVRAQVAIFDAMGHGLDAGLLATAAVAAYRNSRRSGLDLSETATQVDLTIRGHFDERKFVTGVLTSLDIATGRLSWCVAGHPPPLLLRQRRIVKALSRTSGLPFGVGPASQIHEEQLEPGDRLLLYTDGVTEARTTSGELFGIDKLADLVARTTSNDPPPETMRRLMHAIEDHNDGPMRDDATVVMIEWRGKAGRQLEI